MRSTRQRSKYNFKEEAMRTHFQLLYYDPICQVGHDFSRTIKDNALLSTQKQNSKITQFMKKNAVYFCNASNLPRARASAEIEIDGILKRRSSLLEEQFESPSRDQIKQQVAKISDPTFASSNNSLFQAKKLKDIPHPQLSTKEIFNRKAENLLQNNETWQKLSQQRSLTTKQLLQNLEMAKTEKEAKDAQTRLNPHINQYNPSLSKQVSHNTNTTSGDKASNTPIKPNDSSRMSKPNSSSKSGSEERFAINIQPIAPATPVLAAKEKLFTPKRVQTGGFFTNLRENFLKQRQQSYRDVRSWKSGKNLQDIVGSNIKPQN